MYHVNFKYIVSVLLVLIIGGLPSVFFGQYPLISLILMVLCLLITMSIFYVYKKNRTLHNQILLNLVASCSIAVILLHDSFEFLQSETDNALLTLLIYLIVICLSLIMIIYLKLKALSSNKKLITSMKVMQTAGLIIFTYFFFQFITKNITNVQFIIFLSASLFVLALFFETFFINSAIKLYLLNKKDKSTIKDKGHRGNMKSNEPTTEQLKLQRYLKEHLEEGETVLWQGRPDMKIYFREEKINFFYPALFFYIVVVSASYFLNEQHSTKLIYIALWFSLMLIPAAVMQANWFFRKKNTLFAVTNKNVYDVFMHDSYNTNDITLHKRELNEIIYMK